MEVCKVVWQTKLTKIPRKMTPKNFTNLPKSIAHDLKIYYCPVCSLKFAAIHSNHCPECSCRTTLEIDSIIATDIADTHRKAVDKLYALIKMQMRDAQ